MTDDRGREAALLGVLEEARARGFLGPGPLAVHVAHGQAFAQGIDPPTRALDLGSGGGVPGLVLAALLWPDCRWVLLDAGARRCEFLAEAIEELDLSERVEVYRGRAEEAGRLPHLRGAHDLVTARGFGSPAITAECGTPLLVVGGHLVVSEPPGGAPERWSDDGLAALGLTRIQDRPVDPEHAMAVFLAAEPCPDRYPRRVGIPAKRPLF